MKTLSTYLLFCISFLACNSIPTAGEYFGRQQFDQCITSFDSGYMFFNGEKIKIPPKMIIPCTVQDSDYIIDYYEDKEYRLYMCLRFNRCE